jgi:hypothetical protein
VRSDRFTLGLASRQPWKRDVRKVFNTKEAGRTTKGHGVTFQSVSREAQFAFYSVALGGPPCFLRVVILP